MPRSLGRCFFFLVAWALIHSGVAIGGDAPAPAFPTTRRIIADTFRPDGQDRIKIAFFDADSTLRVAPSGKPSANSPTDVAILPLVAPSLVELEKDGYLIAIVSNQGGISQGFVSFQTVSDALAYTVTQLARLGAHVHYFDFAENPDQDRKPQIGMGTRLAALITAKFGKKIDWDHSIMVGDSGWKKGVDVEPDGTPGEDFSNADRLFGENLAKAYGGVTYFHPRVFFHWLRYGVRNFPDFKSVQVFLAQHPDLDPGVNGEAR